MIGPNGAGKTTLFRMIVGEEKPDGGSSTVGSTVAAGLRRPVEGRAQPVMPRSSTRSPAARTGSSSGNRELHGRAYVASFGFTGSDQQKKVGQLSGGERNRVQLAKVLKSGGNVLLLDEPTNDLDVDTLRALEEALLAFRDAPWSSATTDGSSTGSPPTCWPSRGTPRSGGSRGTSATTRRTARSGSASTPTSPTGSGTSRSSAAEVHDDRLADGTFASDNWSGVHPDVLAAIVAANGDHVSSYGDDPVTAARRGPLQTALR